jgi:hypothetical protein
VYILGWLGKPEPALVSTINVELTNNQRKCKRLSDGYVVFLQRKTLLEHAMLESVYLKKIMFFNELIFLTLMGRREIRFLQEIGF